jgi:glycosyltransferase involved in cell wall biosynthesis
MPALLVLKIFTMKIVNAMFAKGLGGIEQAFIDYTNALKLAGHEVICLTHPDAKINERLRQIDGIISYKIPNAGQWDIFAKIILFFIIKKHKAQAIIAHGNRAISLLKLSRNDKCPLIGVAHNYSYKKFRKLDAAFTVTADLKHHLENKTGIKSNKIFAIPNMITLPEKAPVFKPFQSPVVIGTAARHVKKKAIEVLIKAAERLKNAGLNFKLIIGGVGDETETLQALRDNLQLSDEISFIGWVNNKEKFYNQIDIFALPSAHEPFGIVVLEALARKIPLITTESEGPKEIVQNGYDALTCQINNPQAMADKILELVKTPNLAEKLTENGFKNITENYTVNIVSQKLTDALEVIKSDLK